MSRLKDIPKRINLLLSEGKQAQYKLGWINSDLELTTEGRASFTTYQYDKENGDLKGDFNAYAIAELKKVEEEEKEK